MNVCIKANELGLGQDVFQQMLAEGISPNLVTFNILSGWRCVRLAAAVNLAWLQATSAGSGSPGALHCM